MRTAGLNRRAWNASGGAAHVHVFAAAAHAASDVAATALDADDGRPLRSVLVVGAGPAGILAAYLLARRGFDVRVVDARPDPRVEPPKSYSVILGLRAFDAFRLAGADFEAAIRKRCFTFQKVEFSAFGRSGSSEYSEPANAVERTGLVQAMLDAAEAAPLPGPGSLRFRFGARCVGVDLEGRRAEFEGPAGAVEAEAFDVIVGADGVNSAVRGAMEAAGAIEVARTPSPRTGNSCSAEPAPHIPADRVSLLFGEGGAGLMLMPTRRSDGGVAMRAALSVPVTADWAALAADDDSMRAFLRRAFPSVAGQLEPHAGELVGTRPYRTASLRCSRYHLPARALLLGDAAHAVQATIGVGCTCALEDCAALEGLLEESGGDLRAALAAWTARRKPEGDAALELSEAFAARRGPLHSLALLLASRLLASLFPSRFFRSTQDACYSTTLPYSVILRRAADQERLALVVASVALGLVLASLAALALAFV